MQNDEARPSATEPDIKFSALETIDVTALVSACKDSWCDQTLCKVNDSVISLGIRDGEYHWHKHDDDEFFFVLDGHFILDLEDRSVELRPREGFIVPKGVAHRPRALGKTVVLMMWSDGHRSWGSPNASSASGG